MKQVVKILRKKYFWDNEEEKGNYESEDEPSVGEEGNVAEPPFMKSSSAPPKDWEDSLK